MKKFFFLFSIILLSISSIVYWLTKWTDGKDIFKAGEYKMQRDAKESWILGAGTWAQGDERFIDSIERGIKYLLGILGIITVIVLLYGGFEMVTAAGDDAQYKKWFKVLKQAAIGLVFIWLAWLFVMLIFAIVNLMWWTT